MCRIMCVASEKNRKLILVWSLLWVLQEIWIFCIKYAEMLIIYIVYMYTNVIAFSILSHGLGRCSILAWIVIVSVYGTDTIAIDLSLSTRISWFMKSIIGFLNDYNLHAIISTLLIINLHWDKKNYFAVLVEIYNNIGQQPFNYMPYLFYKKRSIQRSILSVNGPWSGHGKETK